MWMTLTEAHCPPGLAFRTGYKASGIGRQNGLERFEEYLETKTVAWLRLGSALGARSDVPVNSYLTKVSTRR